MKLMFVGSNHYNDRYKAPTNFPLEQAGKALGYSAALRGHTILIGSESKNTLDRWAMEGAMQLAQEEPNRQVRIVVYYPERGERIPYQSGDFQLPNLDITWSPQLSLKDEAYPQLIPHLAMLDACDAMISLGGGDNIFVDGCIAAYRKVPVYVIPGSGGAAKLLYDRLQFTYGEQELQVLSDQWKPTSAKEIIELAEMRSRAVDIAIICPLKLEREAVCKALEFTNQNLTTRNGSQYWLGQLGKPEWKAPAYEIVVAQLAAMGNIAAAFTTDDVIKVWKPRAVLLIGIAGGAGDVALGDVVIGSAVLYYEAGKVTPAGIKQEPYMYPADPHLYQRAMTTGMWTESIRARRPSRDRKRPRVHYGVIASGEKVIADESTRDAIVRVHRKIAGLEMEGFGVAAAALRSHVPVRQLVIRGISDMAGQEKSDDWQPYAAAAAASFTRHYLLERPV